VHIAVMKQRLLHAYAFGVTNHICSDDKHRLSAMLHLHKTD
jgi:hypothetical protein